MSTKVTKRKDLSLVYVTEFLERSHDAAVLKKEWEKRYLKNRRTAASIKDRALTDALLSAAIELKQTAHKYVRLAREDGLLLFCFEGSKVLEGGAV